jgi:hypothetical protein
MSPVTSITTYVLGLELLLKKYKKRLKILTLQLAQFKQLAQLDQMAHLNYFQY